MRGGLSGWGQEQEALFGFVTVCSTIQYHEEPLISTAVNRVNGETEGKNNSDTYAWNWLHEKSVFLYYSYTKKGYWNFLHLENHPNHKRKRNPHPWNLTVKTYIAMERKCRKVMPRVLNVNLGLIPCEEILWHKHTHTSIRQSMDL